MSINRNSYWLILAGKYEGKIGVGISGNGEKIMLLVPFNDVRGMSKVVLNGEEFRGAITDARVEDVKKLTPDEILGMILSKITGN